MTQTLAQALKLARDTRWRDNDSCYSQAKIAAMHVAQAKCTALHHYGTPSASEIGRVEMPEVLVSKITEREVRDATAMWYRSGIAPATINKRLNCLSALGVNVNGCREKLKPALKWWLRPEEEERASKWLRDHNYFTVDRLIRWTTHTGLRIEETLRLERQHFGASFTTVTVPGLKTATSQATLPLGPIPRNLVGSYFWDNATMVKLCPTSYDTLKRTWNQLRDAMGWEGNGVTLKALRRSAARYLHVDCGMPLDMVRHYLRHEDLETTLGYLRLTGGYGTEEMRRYLK